MILTKLGIRHPQPTRHGSPLKAPAPTSTALEFELLGALGNTLLADLVLGPGVGLAAALDDALGLLHPGVVPGHFSLGGFLKRGVSKSAAGAR